MLEHGTTPNNGYILCYVERFPVIPESAEESAIGFHLIKLYLHNFNERGGVVLTIPSSTFSQFDQVYDSGSW